MPNQLLPAHINSGRKLRIALFGARGIPHTYSGTEAFFVELAPRLAARGHDVIVYCRRSVFQERPTHYRGVRLIYLPSIETKNLGTFTHTLACMFDVLFRKTDVMMVTNVANGFHCIIPRLFGKHCAMNVDGVEWKRGKWGPIGKRYFYWNAKLIGKIIPRGVVTDAYAMRRIYLEEFGTPSACIAYGGNIEKAQNPNLVRQYGLEPGQYYLIASRLVPENNADLIVEGFRQVHTDKLLAIAGDANYRSEWVRRLKGVSDSRVRFLGHVGDSDHVRELHCGAYAYIHGHSMGGTNPALLKALAYGNCVLAYDTPFNREVVSDYALLFEDAAALATQIRHIEEHPSVASDLRSRAPQRIHQAYSWEHITDQYEELFYRMMAGENPTSTHSSVIGSPEEITLANAHVGAVNN
jgi:glycosyltransferase involved in cell wall biosynthesis